MITITLQNQDQIIDHYVISSSCVRVTCILNG